MCTDEQTAETESYDLAGKAAIPVEETPLAPYDLYMADECFLTGSGAEMIPVREVDGRPVNYCPGEVYTALMMEFSRLVKEIATAAW